MQDGWTAIGNGAGKGAMDKTYSDGLAQRMSQGLEGRGTSEGGTDTGIRAIVATRRHILRNMSRGCMRCNKSGTGSGTRGGARTSTDTDGRTRLCSLHCSHRRCASDSRTGTGTGSRTRVTRQTYTDL